MRKLLTTAVCLSLISLWLAGCDRKNNATVKISVDVAKAKNDTLRISMVNMVTIEPIDLSKIVLDSNGKGMLEFKLDRPVFVGATSAHIGAGLFISPGDELVIKGAPEGSKSAVRFEGDGADVNQYLGETAAVRNQLEKWNGKYAFQLETKDFLIARDSLQRSYDRLFTKFKSEHPVSAEMGKLLALQNQMSLLFYQQNFAMSKDTSELPESIRSIVGYIPIDTSAMNTRMFDYALVASTFLQKGIFEPLYEEKEKMNEDSLAVLFPLLVDQKIKESKYPPQLEDFFRIKNINYHLGMEGLSPELEKLGESLRKEIASQEYISVMQKDIDKWLPLAPGKMAPDFTGITPDGKKFSLSDLRGKVVYVDIWATWCGPCRDEFPDAKKVQADFKGNDRLTFLYVSVDRDKLAWKKMVADGEVPNGIQINDQSEGPGSIWTLYHVWGVPRYILIDSQGKMVAAHAVRPSSGKLTAQLRQLLETDRVAKSDG